MLYFGLGIVRNYFYRDIAPYVESIQWRVLPSQEGLLQHILKFDLNVLIAKYEILQKEKVRTKSVMNLV